MGVADRLAGGSWRCLSSPVLERLLANPGGGSWVPLPVFPRWGLLLQSLVGSSPFLAEGWVLVYMGLVGGFLVLCVFVAQAGVRGARAFVCFVCLWCLYWWWCRCGSGPSSACARWCVCACACDVWVVALVACPRFSRLGLAAVASVGVAGVCCGWAPVSPG